MSVLPANPVESKLKWIASPPRTVAEVIQCWDEGGSFRTVNVGGLGPSYDQAIQILVVEILRATLGQAHDTDSFSDVAQKVCADIDDSVGGLTGAQFMSGRSLAWRAYAVGWAEMLAEIPNDRFCMVSRDFPQAPAAPVQTSGK